MLVGTYPVGQTPLGDSYPWALVTVSGDDYVGRLQTMVQESPVVTFYELETTDLEYLRFVDIADKDGSVTPGAIDFRGYQWTSANITRTPIDESTQGDLPTITITVADPLRNAFTWAKDRNGLRGAKVRIWVIPYDMIGTPDVARTWTLRVRNSFASEGPASFNVVLGPPDLFDAMVPRIHFSRDRCVNDWAQRFNHSAVNACTYPSDDFELPTKQDFLGEWDEDGDGNPLSEYGWDYNWKIGEGITVPEIALTAAIPTVAENGFTGTDRVCRIQFTGSSDEWEDANRDGPYVYKTFDPDDGTLLSTIDVESKFFVTGSHAVKSGGILIQDIDTPSSWVFWGYADKDVFTHLSRMRKTESDVSTDWEMTDSGHRAYRIRKVGDDWTFYTRSESLTEITFSTDDWTERTTTTLSMGSNLRVGFVCGTASSKPSLDVRLAVCHFRFQSGGLENCPRAWADCVTRGNVHQFTGMLSMPDGPVRFGF